MRYLYEDILPASNITLLKDLNEAAYLYLRSSSLLEEEEEIQRDTSIDHPHKLPDEEKDVFESEKNATDEFKSPSMLDNTYLGSIKITANDILLNNVDLIERVTIQPGEAEYQQQRQYSMESDDLLHSGTEEFPDAESAQ